MPSTSSRSTNKSHSQAAGSSTKRKHEDTSDSTHKRVKVEPDDRTDLNTSTSNIIELVVGSNAKIFRVHKQSLCSQSKHFREFLASPLRAAPEHRVVLEDVSEIAVKCFVDWLYCAPIIIDDRIIHNLADVVRFGLMTGSENYQNQLMDSYRDYSYQHGRTLSANGVADVYRKGMRQSNLARFCLQSLVYKFTSQPSPYLQGNHYSNLISRLSGERDLIHDFVAELQRHNKAPYGRPSRWRGCQFHVHTDGSTCSAGNDL